MRLKQFVRHTFCIVDAARIHQPACAGQQGVDIVRRQCEGLVDRLARFLVLAQRVARLRREYETPERRGAPVSRQFLEHVLVTPLPHEDAIVQFADGRRVSTCTTCALERGRCVLHVPEAQRRSRNDQVRIRVARLLVERRLRVAHCRAVIAGIELGLRAFHEIACAHEPLASTEDGKRRQQQ